MKITLEICPETLNLLRLACQKESTRTFADIETKSKYATICSELVRLQKAIGQYEDPVEKLMRTARKDQEKRAQAMRDCLDKLHALQTEYDR